MQEIRRVLLEHEQRASKWNETVNNCHLAIHTLEVRRLDMFWHVLKVSQVLTCAFSKCQERPPSVSLVMFYKPIVSPVMYCWHVVAGGDWVDWHSAAQLLVHSDRVDGEYDGERASAIPCLTVPPLLQWWHLCWQVWQNSESPFLLQFSIMTQSWFLFVGARFR